MTLVKVGKREAVFRVVITTAAATTSYLVVAGDQHLAANRAAKEAGLDRHRGYAIKGMEIERLTEKLPPSAAQGELRRLSAASDAQGQRIATGVASEHEDLRRAPRPARQEGRQHRTPRRFTSSDAPDDPRSRR
jgi:hypothetical protein